MLSEQDKQDRKAIKNLDFIARAIRSQFSFGKIKTFRDLLLSSGYTDKIITDKYFSSELDKKLSYADIQEFLSDRYIELTTAQWLQKNPPTIEPNNYDINTKTDKQIEERNNQLTKNIKQNLGRNNTTESTIQQCEAITTTKKEKTIEFK